MMLNTELMQRALTLADKGRYTTQPNPRVGCVIVKQGHVIGEGWHHYAGQAHAEVLALQQAGKNARDAQVYVTLEPCSHTGRTPPCAEALIKAGVKKVFIAMSDPNPQVAGRGIRMLQGAGIKTELGLLEQQARALNPGFIKRMESGRPFVRIKLAMSLDGRTAMASGESKWISGEHSRSDVQRLRAESCAILTGIGTVLADNPSMDVRLSAQQLGVETVRQPQRIVLDSQFRIPAFAKITKPADSCTVYTSIVVENSEQYPFKINTIDSSASGVDLTALLEDLADNEINLLHVEAGSILSGALLQQGLVDEIIVYIAPHIMGDNAKGLFHLPGLEQMCDRISLQVKDIRAIGNDLRVTLLPVT